MPNLEAHLRQAQHNRRECPGHARVTGGEAEGCPERGRRSGLASRRPRHLGLDLGEGGENRLFQPA